MKNPFSPLTVALWAVYHWTVQAPLNFFARLAVKTKLVPDTNDEWRNKKNAKSMAKKMYVGVLLVVVVVLLIIFGDANYATRIVEGSK